MVQFIITILLQGTRLTPEFSINIKAFFCFSEKHRMEFYRTRFFTYETFACAPSQNKAEKILFHKLHNCMVSPEIH